MAACVMVHNMAPTVGACIQTLQWTDGIFLFDDHSTDQSAAVSVRMSKTPIVVESSPFADVAFRVGEMRVRNRMIDSAFSTFDADAVVVVDADELVHVGLRAVINRAFATDTVDSIAFTTWHLFDAQRYLHFWPTTINGVAMLDPHTRVIRRSGKRFVPLFPDGSHPILEATPSTLCLHAPLHFHLKYHKFSKLPNYSLPFLPERIRERDAAPFLRALPFRLPDDIAAALARIDWQASPLYDHTPHYGMTRRLSEESAWVHPRDIPRK